MLILMDGAHSPEQLEVDAPFYERLVRAHAAPTAAPAWLLTVIAHMLY